MLDKISTIHQTICIYETMSSKGGYKGAKGGNYLLWVLSFVSFVPFSLRCVPFSWVLFLLSWVWSFFFRFVPNSRESIVLKKYRPPPPWLKSWIRPWCLANIAIILYSARYFRADVVCLHRMPRSNVVFRATFLPIPLDVLHPIIRFIKGKISNSGNL